MTSYNQGNSGDILASTVFYESKQNNLANNSENNLKDTQFGKGNDDDDDSSSSDDVFAATKTINPLLSDDEEEIEEDIEINEDEKFKSQKIKNKSDKKNDEEASQTFEFLFDSYSKNIKKSNNDAGNNKKNKICDSMEYSQTFDHEDINFKKEKEKKRNTDSQITRPDKKEEKMKKDNDKEKDDFENYEDDFIDDFIDDWNYEQINGGLEEDDWGF